MPCTGITTLPDYPSTTTTSTRTHNQPQFPPGHTVALAEAIENDPHLASNEAACLCSSCHLTARIFPRSQDGRIVLPHPSSFIHSTRLPRSVVNTTTAASPVFPGVDERKRVRVESASNLDPKSNQGRRSDGLRTPHLQSDKGEGSSTGAGRMSANTGENWTTLPRRSREYCSDESLHTPQLSRQGKHSSSGSSKRARLSKKRNQKPERPDPWPGILESDELVGQPSHLTTLQSSSLDKSRRRRLELHLNKHGTTHPQNLQARELSPQTGRLETPHHHSGSRPADSPTLTVNAAQDKAIIIRFSSDNLETSNNPEAPTTSGRKSVDSSPTREPPPPSLSFSSSTSSYQLLQPSLSSSRFQTQFQFQEPVVPSEAHITGPIRPRELQVKWDSERKRRQGYFAQEEGSEKSPFRHYNKAECNFED